MAVEPFAGTGHILAFEGGKHVLHHLRTLNNKAAMHFAIFLLLKRTDELYSIFRYHIGKFTNFCSIFAHNLLKNHF